jgi:dipeptidyl-peptidase-4
MNQAAPVSAREFASSFPRQYARTRRFSTGVPGQFTVSPDGNTVIFVRTRGGTDPVACLWAMDCRTGRQRLVADPLALLAGADEELPEQERIRRERTGQTSSGIVSYAADEACDLVAFALSGQLWTAGLANGVVRRLPAAGPVVDPRPDPSGLRVAYVAGGGLRVIEADGSADGAVAGPEGGDVTWGLAEHAAGESMGRHRGYWWAPDGSRLLVARADSSMVQRWYVTDPSEPAQPPVAFRYPSAGTANAEVSLWIASLREAGGGLTSVDWDNKTHEYLTSAGWDSAGPYAAVQTRDQHDLRVLGLEPETGATRILAEQHDDTWVTLVPGLPARTASGVLLTSANAGDTYQLLADGVPVTPPGLQLEAVLAVDGERVLFTAADAEPTEIHLYAFEHGSGVIRLSDVPGVHGGTGQGGCTVLVSGSPRWPGTRTTILSAHGSAEITSFAEAPGLVPRMELLKLGPRELRAALFLPSRHRPGDPALPVLMDPYGGPAAQKVLAELDAAGSYVSQWFAEQGFAVLVADGRGTPGRGPGWDRSIYLDVAGPALEDQVEALEAATVLRDELDPGKVAIRGWSFGGFLAALAVLRRPDDFHAAVAGAPVTEHRLYDTHWRERHLGHPAEHPEAYERSSLIPDAPSLIRPLLLIHGLADDNVVAAHTLRLSAALLAAGRPHEVLPLPRATHHVSDTTVVENMLWHQLAFLRRALGLAVPGDAAAGQDPEAAQR